MDNRVGKRTFAQCKLRKAHFVENRISDREVEFIIKMNLSNEKRIKNKNKRKVKMPEFNLSDQED